MMGQLVAERDVESLQASGGRSRCCLDAFLVTSVIFLFVAVAAVATVVVWQQPQLLSQEGPAGTSAAGAMPLSVSIKAQQNFVYVHATTSELRNRTVTFAERLYGDSSSVGPNFDFKEDQSLLTPLIAGTYFMFVKVNLTCVHHCAAGRLRLDVSDKLSCELLLPVKLDKAPVSRQCWSVQRLGRKGLQTTMTVFSEEQLGNWRLELDTSGLGMFLVD